MNEDLPHFLQVYLDDVRKLEMSYSCANPSEEKLTVVYVGGRVRVPEMNPWLFERLLSQLDEEIQHKLADIQQRKMLCKNRRGNAC